MDRTTLAAARSAGRTAGRRNRRGAALVFVLAILSVLATLLWYLLAASRTSLASAEAVVAADRLRAAASDAVRRALQRMGDDDDPLADTLDEDWTVDEILTDPTGLTTRTRVVDEDRRFDVNNLSLDEQTVAARPADEIVADLLRLCGDPSPSPKVEALRDWVDAGSVGRFETAYYAEKRLARACADAPLGSWREWALIEGFPRAYLDDPSLGDSDAPPVPVASVLAIAPGPHRRPVPVNVNTAPERVLLGVFGIGQEGLVRSVLSMRDAFPMRSLDAIAAIADPLMFDRVRPYLDVRSWRFAVTSVATDDQGREARVAAFAVREPQGGMRVLRWVE